MSVTYDVDTRRLEQILRNLPGNTEQGIRAVGFALEAAAKTKAPVDTGALQNSIYTVTAKHDGYPAVTSDADRVRLPRPKEDEGFVGPSVDYGLYQELGTRYTAAQPFLLPAVREVEGHLADHFRNVVTG
jgi:HK97 gp10 family phage protein